MMDSLETQEPPFTVADTFGRPLKALRISVTDRCNLRCQYCMPEEEYVWLPRETLLTFEEMSTLTSVFTDLGVDKVRITGGEPLLRKKPASLNSPAPSEYADPGHCVNHEWCLISRTSPIVIRGWSAPGYRESRYDEA